MTLLTCGAFRQVSETKRPRRDRWFRGRGKTTEGPRAGNGETDMQELITEEVAEGIPALYAQEEAEDPVVYLHLFSCVSGWDWYIT